MDEADVTRVGTSFVTTQQGLCKGSCHRAGEQMGQEVMGARTRPTLFRGSQ